MPTNLSVNLNAIAMLRNRRDLAWPSVTGIGAMALEAGAHGLTVHPRPDERHIRLQDVYDLSALIKKSDGRKEFNIEGFPDDRLFKIIEDVKPDQVTLVPDDPEQNTSDHGWDIEANKEMLGEVVAQIKNLGCRVSLFIDSEPEVALGAGAVGADRVEIYTGPYGLLIKDSEIKAMLAQIKLTCDAAGRGGLQVNAGHDLTLDNLPALISMVPNIAECSIGHCLTADCLLYGVNETVNRYLRALGH